MTTIDDRERLARHVLATADALRQGEGMNGRT
jgi:hypothetical protein